MKKSSNTKVASTAPTTAFHFDKIWVNHPMPEDYTCGCGLYVHPTQIEPAAIHCSDCDYK